MPKGWEKSSASPQDELHPWLCLCYQPPFLGSSSIFRSNHMLCCFWCEQVTSSVFPHFQRLLQRSIKPISCLAKLNEMSFGDFFVCWLACSQAQTTFLIPSEGLEEKTKIPCKGRGLDKATGTQYPILCPNWAVFTSGCLRCRPSLMRRWGYLPP